jgi:hypothetical protein
MLYTRYKGLNAAFFVHSKVTEPLSSVSRALISTVSKEYRTLQSSRKLLLDWKVGSDYIG